MHPKQSRAKDLFLQGYTFQEIGTGIGLSPATLRKWASTHHWHEQKAAAAQRRLQLEDLSSRLHGILQQQMDYLYHHTYNGQLPEGPAACYRNLTESLANVHKVLALSIIQPILHLPPPTDTPKRKTRKQAAAEVSDKTIYVPALFDAPIPEVGASNTSEAHPTETEEVQGDVMMQPLDNAQREVVEIGVEPVPEATSQPIPATPIREAALTVAEMEILQSQPRLNHKARQKLKHKENVRIWMAAKSLPGAEDMGLGDFLRRQRAAAYAATSVPDIE